MLFRGSLLIETHSRTDDSLPHRFRRTRSPALSPSCHQALSALRFHIWSWIVERSRSAGYARLAGHDSRHNAEPSSLAISFVIPVLIKIFDEPRAETGDGLLAKTILDA